MLISVYYTVWLRYDCQDYWLLGVFAACRSFTYNTTPLSLLGGLRLSVLNITSAPKSFWIFNHNCSEGNKKFHQIWGYPEENEGDAERTRVLFEMQNITLWLVTPSLAQKRVNTSIHVRRQQIFQLFVHCEPHACRHVALVRKESNKLQQFNRRSCPSKVNLVNICY